MQDSTKKKIVRLFWILFAAPFCLIFLLLIIVWMFARIPSFEELEHPDSKLVLVMFVMAKASKAEQMISSIIATRLNDTNNREVSEASTNAIVDAIRSK